MNDIKSAQEVTCPKCKGLGVARWAKPDGRERDERCDLCDGFGHVQSEQRGAGDAQAQFETWLAPIWSREGQVDADGDFVYNDEWVQGAWIGYQAALAALAARQLAATERKEDGWIDVSERKPEHAQEVLFVLDGKTVAGAWIGGIFWYSNQKRAALWWQPFPKPRIGAATHPQPAAPAAAVPEDVQRDAERFRILMSNYVQRWKDSNTGAPSSANFCFECKGWAIDKALDDEVRAMAAQPQGKGVGRG